jgi:hypothetical protein
LNEVASSKGRVPDANSGGGGIALSIGTDAREAVSRIVDTMRRFCLRNLGAQLKALILTGSLARDEATWQCTHHSIHFLSDAEFIVIMIDGGEIPSSQLVNLICSGVEEELRNQGILCKLSFGAVYESFLLNLGETIFGYELLTCGKVVYGDPDILRTKSRRTHQVSQEDAWRMLANRTVELLEIVPEFTGGPASLSEAAQYRLTKLYCDMATSLLVFKQEFVAGYQARVAKLCELHAHGLLSDLPFDEDRFVDMVRRCTDYKISHSWHGVSPIATQDSLRQAVAVLRSLWAWELAQIHGATMPSPDAMLQLHMRKQSLVARLRGWAFVIRRRGMLDSLRHTWRWLRLMRLASPRYSVYAAALETVSSFQFQVSSTAQHGQLETRNPKLETAWNWLPVADPPVRTAPNETETAEAILWNYREFLVETRA